MIVDRTLRCVKFRTTLQCRASQIFLWLDSTFLATSTSSAPQSSELQIIGLSDRWIDKASRKKSSNPNETTN